VSAAIALGGVRGLCVWLRGCALRCGCLHECLQEGWVLVRVVNPRSDRPVYKQIADRLRSAIRDGVYAPGDLLPSEHELAAEYGVARGTARQAILLLRNEGLIDAVHGLGCFVREPEPFQRLRPSGASADWEIIRELEDDDEGPLAEALTMTYATTQLERARPPAAVAKLLGLPADAEVLVRGWEAIDESGVRTIALAYTRWDVATQARLFGLESGPAVYLMLTASGYQITRIIEEVSARMPSTAEAQRLDLGPGVPVLSVQRVNYTAQDTQPIEVTVSVMSAERYRMVYDLGDD
jgi:GntR family transcriptional regulator